MTVLERIKLFAASVAPWFKGWFVKASSAPQAEAVAGETAVPVSAGRSWAKAAGDLAWRFLIYMGRSFKSLFTNPLNYGAIIAVFWLAWVWSHEAATGAASITLENALRSMQASEARAAKAEARAVKAEKELADARKVEPAVEPRLVKTETVKPAKQPVKRVSK